MIQLSTSHSAATTATLRKRLIVALAQLRRALNRWVAADIANRERQAARILLRSPDARDVSPIGLIKP